MNRQLEVAHRSSVEKDLQALLIGQSLGEYNCVEVTEIFAITENEAPPTNIFTIMVAESRESKNLTLDEYVFVNDKPIKVSILNSWIIGIKTYLVSINKAIEMFATAESDNNWDSCGQKVKTPEYGYKKRTFTPPDSFEAVPLNSVLKNNFNNGSYVVELINQHKTELSIFFEKTTLLQELADGLLKYLPIDISSLSDRLGNVIFQIPVKAIQTRTTLLSNRKSIECKIAWHSNIQPRDLMICGYKEDDDFNKDDFHIVHYSKTSESVTIPFNHKGAYRLTIWDVESELTLNSLAPSSFITTTAFSSNVMAHEQRELYHNDGSRSSVPLIIHSGTSTVGDKPRKNTDWSKVRIYENNRGKLRESLEFVQYNPKGKNKEIEHEKALLDIRSLINLYGENGVYLWDPYLSPNDIIKTLFHSRFTNSSLKAISSLKEPPIENKNNINSIFDNYKIELESYPPEMKIGIDLQFRSPRNNNGWKFHDRFLIFPDFNKLPMAWSLGTSVNSFGQEHHILQKCGDARLILDAFNELWAEIDKDECLVWGSK
ncbi:VPA1262 family N-terminal domain-containing protein [Pseudoalteromonas aliena]|uniref:VPA1262 family N-terminal domain-containing protein n=1 Tax=Pseudoalteromonas aliena TaxID=247523 RepID=UPI00312025B2